MEAIGISKDSQVITPLAHRLDVADIATTHALVNARAVIHVGCKKNPEKIAFAVSSKKILSFFATCDGLNSFSRFLGTKKP